ncbi:MAG: histidinol dehydrogenase [Myxococcota bacterium]|nr:histidinol dehydrogenase [Myxococcota bacterium]
MIALRFVGELGALSSPDREALLRRTGPLDAGVRAAAAALVDAVALRGDAELRAQALRFDGVELTTLEVPRAALVRALDALAPEVRRALDRAAANLAKVHSAQRPSGFELEIEPGVFVGRRADPLGAVGVYAPGGRATYPSSVLMGAVPARVAGVGQVVLCTPPGRSGAPAPQVLAAAAIAQVDRVFAVGGAGAIAALAFGTETVPRVDRIVGPGNAYVAAAKLLVVDRVAIDSPAGPSELLALADDDGDASAIARELLAQAEHDPEAAVVVIAPATVAAGVRECLNQLLPSAPREEIIRSALARRGAILACNDLDAAIAFGNAFAPEHLLLDVRNPQAALAKVRNAGTVFLGRTSSVAFGDYLTGSNHVLPTSGLARAYSGLSAGDFYRWTPYQRVTRAGAALLAADAACLAESEGLFAHAAAAAAWSAS